MTKRDGLLWRYTDANGLLGILGHPSYEQPTCSVWASSVTYLNDRTELDFGIQCTSRALATLAEEMSGQGRAEVAREMTKFSVHYLEGRVTRPDVFATSLSEEGDLLSQWSMYGAGGGFAIGFDPVLLVDTPTTNVRGLQLVQVAYGDDAEAACLATLRSKVTDAGLSFKDVWTTKELYGGWKDPSFAAEKEYRLTVTDQPNATRTRARGGKLLPYVEVAIDPAAVCRVRVGPCDEPHQQVRAAQHFVNLAWFEVALRSDESGVFVDASRVPYRG